MIFICKYKSIIRQPTYQKMELNNGNCILYNCNDCDKEFLKNKDDWTRCEECAKHYHSADSDCEEDDEDAKHYHSADEICSCCDKQTYFICYTCGDCDNCCDCQACCDCQEVKIACNIQTDDDGKYYCGYCWETRPADDEECDEEKEEHPAYKFFEERDCAYCRVFFEQGKDNCKECGFDLNSWNKEEEKEEAIYCYTCKEEAYIYCDTCGCADCCECLWCFDCQEVITGNIRTDDEGKNYCDDCLFEKWDKEEEKEELCCECCEYVTEYKEDQENKGEFYCLPCFEKRERCECDDCGDMVIADWTISHMGVTFCRPCFAQPRDE